MSVVTKELDKHWAGVSPLISIRDEDDYERATETLNELLDEIGCDEQHPLHELQDTLGTVIQAYVEAHQPMRECSGAEALQFLMD